MDGLMSLMSPHFHKNAGDKNWHEPYMTYYKNSQYDIDDLKWQE